MTKAFRKFAKMRFPKSVKTQQRTSIFDVFYNNPQGSAVSWVKKSAAHQNIIIFYCAQDVFSPFSPRMVFRAKLRPQKPSLYGGKGGQKFMELVPAKHSLNTPKYMTCGYICSKHRCYCSRVLCCVMCAMSTEAII